MAKKKVSAAGKPPASDPRFAAVIKALGADRRFRDVIAAYRAEQAAGIGNRFGAGGLKIDGKLFAFMSSKGHLVLKLAKARVDSLVAEGQGENFDPGHGRKMKEWIAITGAASPWLELVREAHEFVSGPKRK